MAVEEAGVEARQQELMGSAQRSQAGEAEVGEVGAVRRLHPQACRAAGEGEAGEEGRSPFQA